MKTTILSIALFLIISTGKSQSNQYASAMGESLSQYSNSKTIEDFKALGHRFGLIANAEKSEWLPLYYHAHCYILMSFMEPADAAKKDSYLDIAEQSLTKMIEVNPKESEIFTLQSMFYSARLLVNPMERGQKYSALSAQAIGMALGLDSKNPRAKFMKLRNDMGTAQFFGKDPNEYCPQASELLASWDSYKIKSPLYPAWGKAQVQELVEECKGAN